MISNTTKIEIRDMVVLSNPIDIDFKYNIFYSGCRKKPFRVLLIDDKVCKTPEIMTLNQLIKFLDIKKEFPIETLTNLIPK